MRNYFAVLFAVTIFGIPWLWYNHNDFVVTTIQSIHDASLQLATVVVTHKPKTEQELKDKYTMNILAMNPSIKIMIVPGHEPDYGGAEYGKLKERELNTVLADDLAGFIKKNSKYEVMVTRTDDAWNPVMQDYFAKNWDAIIEWNNSYKAEKENLMSVGKIKDVIPSVIHNKAPVGPATRLMGINKWGKENDVDVVIHIHFNDDREHRALTPGKYSGFAVYVPENQYYNSSTTKAVAEKIMERLAKYNPVSDLKGENTGIIESPDLIAIGANNSLDAASLLIEYGYIYESQFRNESTRDLAIKDLAYQTYLGLQDFFDPQNSKNLSMKYDTLMLPYSWNNDLSENSNKSASQDIFAMQTALISDGVYPPQEKSSNDCPRSGSIGACTKASLQEFQKKYGISGEKNIVGEKTREVLNRVYGK